MTAARLTGRPWHDVDGPVLVASAAALQLIPQNIPRLVRLQRLASIGACLPSRPDAPRLSPSKLRALLKDPLVSGSQIRAQEDLYDDLYTAEVSFHGGPCLVAQGLTSRCAHTLDLMLRSILGPDGQAGLPAQFVRETQLWAHTALRLSDAMLRRAGLHRGIATPQRHSDEVFVPGEKTLTALREAVRYRFTDLSDLLPASSADLLAGWGIRPGEHTLTTGPGPDDGLVVKPLLLMEDGLIVANPAELVTALRHELIVQAGLHACRPQLARLLRDQTMRDTSRLLTLCGAVPTGPAQQVGDDLITRRTFTFAEDKILDLAVVMDDLSDYDETNPAGHWPIRDLGLRVQNVVDPVGPPLPEDACTLRLIINEGVGRSSFLGLADQRRTGPVVVTSLSDLQVMAELDGSDPLFLWRFAQAETELHETTRVQSWSALDNYGLFRNCEYSYYVSDDARPTMLLVEQDHSRALRIEVQQRYDRHDVPSPQRAVFVPVVSVYGTSTAPIYRPLPDVPEVGRLVEVSDLNVWLGAGDHEVADGLEGFHHLVVEAAAFWTWQISTARPELLPLAASTGELYVSLSFDDPSAWQAALDGNPGTESERPWVGVRGAEPGLVDLRLYAEGMASLLADANGADRILLRALLEGIAQTAGLVDEDLDALVDQLAPEGHKQMLHVELNPRLPLRPGPLPTARLVQPAASARVLDELGRYLDSAGTPVGTIPSEKRTQVLQKVVGHYFALIEDMVAGLAAEGLVESLTSLHEALLYDEAFNDQILPSRIACFGEASQPAENLVRTTKRQVEAAQASRFLIEYVAAQPPSGDSSLTLDTYDHLMALSAELISRATLSEAIHHDFSEAQLALLASGRLGVSRGDQYESGSNALATARAEALLLAAPTRHSRRGSEPQGPTAQVEEAMVAEFGFSLTDLAQGVGEVIALGDERCQSEPYTLSESVVADHLSTTLHWEHEKAQTFLDQLTLRPRAKFLSVNSDAWPWRYNREWSYVRRPLIRVGTGDGSQLVWGARHTWSSGSYWVNLIYSGRLRSTSSLMKKLLGVIRQDENKAFEAHVVDTLRAGGCSLAVRGVSKIAGRRLTSVEGHDLGDIDALGINAARRVIIVIEAKDFEMARNPTEMANEADALLRGDKSALFKLGRRTEWVRQNLAATLTHFLGDRDSTSWTVTSAIVTSRDLMAPRVLASNVPVVPISEFEQWVAAELVRGKRGNGRRRS
ncbi:hypothetical protein ABZT08_23835 [Streptomyces sp. NPDC005526]|uniref:hypothetical protein n=1 Tax=Streptomyces sp. NPDC005526 TaxID=3156885 RepID=UPI00339FCB7C